MAFPSPVLVVGARLLPREARGIHRHGTGARRTMVPDQAHRCGQHARQQPRLHLVAWEPPPRRMVRHRAQREGGPEFLSARQQRFSPPLVPVSIFCQTQAGEPRRVCVPLWRKFARMIGHLLPCELPGQTCEVKYTMTFHCKSPPSFEYTPGSGGFRQSKST